MALFKALVVLPLIVLCGAEVHHKMEKMYMQRHMSSDLAPEASGYIYRSDSHGPASYIQLGSGAVHHQMNYPQPAPIAPQPYVYSHAPQYQEPNFHPVPITSYVQHHQPIEMKIVHEAPAKKIEEKHEEPEVNDEDSGEEHDEGFADDEGHDYADKINYHFDAIGKEPSYEGNFEADAGHHGGKFNHGGGHAFATQHHSAHGDKGDKGYKSYQHFDKGQVGHHGKEGHKGHYSDEGGHKKSHLDDAHKYSSHHEAAKGSKGGEFSEKKGHKKGSKTTGFHNVYHKDEFKKEHKFYDDADKSGHFKKHGDHASEHDSSEGGHLKKGHHDSAYHHDAFGKKGFTDKGHLDSSDKGHSSKAGGEQFHKSYSDYAKKGGNSDGKEYGYSEKH